MAGLMCPKCGEETSVVDTRLYAFNRLMRIRYCTNKQCKVRFTTKEVIDEGSIRRQLHAPIKEIKNGNL